MIIFCRSAHAQPFPPRPHKPLASFLAADPVSQLLHCVPATDHASSGCRRPARKEKYTAHREAALVTACAFAAELLLYPTSFFTTFPSTSVSRKSRPR